MKIIEFFGLPGSGKTYFKKKLIKKYLYNYKVYDYRSFNLKFHNKNLLTRIYFSLIKNDNFKKIKNFLHKKKINISILNFFYNSYQSNIDASTTIKDSNILNFIKLLIKNSNFANNKKKTFFSWAKEEIIANQLAKKIKDNNKILIDSEGLIQRLLIYCYKKKNKKIIIKKYLSVIKLPDVVVFFDKIYLKKISSKSNIKEMKMIINSDIGLLYASKKIINKNI